MKKSAAWLIVLFFLLPSCYASIYYSEYLILGMNISNEFEIKSTSPQPIIEFITINTSFFPKQYSDQLILDSIMDPEPDIDGDNEVFEWKNPTEKNLGFSTYYRLKMFNDNPFIYKKVKFPAEGIPDNVKMYTKPAEIIDINDDIIGVASDLAEGEDDLVEVVDKIAYWVNSNIVYNLSSTAAEASLKSSWVLKNREGVCDELTSLFISMVRSMGIPARFVAGVSYTELEQFKNNWGPHGWAEVYFPGYGWVPYDVTYGEYGWTDPTHIITRISDDAGKIYSNYAWKAEEGVNLKAHELNTKVDILEIGKIKNPGIEISPSMLYNSVGFGSYNAVIVTIKNSKDYYISKDFYIARTNKVSVIGENKRHILLRPGEIKEIYWLLKVDDDLDRNYIYTFPVGVMTVDNVSATTDFLSVEEAEFHLLEHVNSTISSMQKESEKVYSKNIEIGCSLDKKEYYVYEKPMLSCRLKNLGNIMLKNLNICLEQDCTERTLGIQQEKDVNFTIIPKNGLNMLMLSVKNDQLSSTKEISFEGLDEPKLGIKEMEFPAEVSYKQQFSIKFKASKESGSIPYNVLINVSSPSFSKIYRFDNLNETKEYSIDLKGKNLDIGNNKFKFSIVYKDKNGRSYRSGEEIDITLANVTFFQKMMIRIRNIFR